VARKFRLGSGTAAEYGHSVHALRGPAAGWVDTFRRFEEGADHYSWWSQRFGIREKNIGWRIDYVLASPAAMKHVTGAFIHPNVRGSDHCPVGVDVSGSIFG